MTGLERELTKIIESIAKASASSRALAALLRRKEAICLALAAPEQSWLAPQRQAAAVPVRQRKAA
jgi:hypothetical protein